MTEVLSNSTSSPIEVMIVLQLLTKGPAGTNEGNGTVEETGKSITAGFVSSKVTRLA